jgi:hypothetical protein
VADEQVRNHFMVRVINKRNESRSFTLRLAGEMPAGMKATGTETPLVLDAQAEEVRPVVLTLPLAAYDKPHKVTLQVTDTKDGKSAETRVMEFTGPAAQSLNPTSMDASKYLQK